MHGKAITSHTL